MLVKAILERIWVYYMNIPNRILEGIWEANSREPIQEIGLVLFSNGQKRDWTDLKMRYTFYIWFFNMIYVFIVICSGFSNVMFKLVLCRMSKEYQVRVEEFVEFAKTNSEDNNTTRCPYKKMLQCCSIDVWGSKRPLDDSWYNKFI